MIENGVMRGKTSAFMFREQGEPYSLSMIKLGE